MPHVTVVGTFAIDWSVNEIINHLSQALSIHAPASSSAIDHAYLGPKKGVHVVLLDRTDTLMKLHTDILTTLNRGGLQLNRPDYEGENYLPHSTVYNNHPLKYGAVVRFTALSLVDMFPANDPYKRKILKTIKVGNNISA